MNRYFTTKDRIDWVRACRQAGLGDFKACAKRTLVYVKPLSECHIWRGQEQHSRVEGKANRRMRRAGIGTMEC